MCHCPKIFLDSKENMYMVCLFIFVRLHCELLMLQRWRKACLGALQRMCEHEHTCACLRKSKVFLSWRVTLWAMVTSWEEKKRKEPASPFSWLSSWDFAYLSNNGSLFLIKTCWLGFLAWPWACLVTEDLAGWSPGGVWRWPESPHLTSWLIAGSHCLHFFTIHTQSYSSVKDLQWKFRNCHPKRKGNHIGKRSKIQTNCKWQHQHLFSCAQAGAAGCASGGHCLSSAVLSGLSLPKGDMKLTKILVYILSSDAQHFLSIPLLLSLIGQINGLSWTVWTSIRPSAKSSILVA